MIKRVALHPARSALDPRDRVPRRGPTSGLDPISAGEVRSAGDDAAAYFGLTAFLW